MKPLIIIGASGHGKVVADIAIKNGYRDIMFVDDDIEKKECIGFPVVGKTIDAIALEGDKIIAIGDATVRRKIHKEINQIALIHPDAVIGNKVTIGEGTVVMAGTVINPDTSVGCNCIINTCASIDHDCRIADYVHVSVGAHICGTVSIGEETWVGAGAIISNNISICGHCVIGAGAVVIKDINESGTYVGVPAKRIDFKANAL